jgi:hypothetical protein
MTRGRDRLVSPPSPRRGRRRGLAALATLGLAAAACSTGSGAGGVDASPTFARANGTEIAIEEPLANVSDLLGPTGEGEPWTIVGSLFDPDARSTQAAVWTSPDSREWERTTVDHTTGASDESMAAVAGTDAGLLAVGQTGHGPEADAGIWRLAEGEWRASRPPDMGGTHEQWASEIAVGEGGIVVAGGENAWGELRPRLWFSADGEEWSSVDGGPGGAFDAPGEEAVRAVTAVGAGFVAVGWRSVDNEQDGVVWFSPDGESWEEVEDPELGQEGRQALLTVAVVQGVVVAGGYVDDVAGQGQPAVWRSADGKGWNPPVTKLPMSDKRVGVRDLAVRSLSVDGERMVAAGGNDWRPHVWRSDDAGVTWKEERSPVSGDLFQDGVSLRDAVTAQDSTVAIAAGPTVLVLKGPRWEEAPGDAFPKGGEQPFTTSVATGADAELAAGGRRTAPSGEAPENFDGQVWRHVDGAWRAQESENLAAGLVMDLAAFPGGFVAVGVENRALAAERGVVADKEPDGLVWVSPDGETWARIGTRSAEVNADYLEYLDDPRPELAPGIAALEATAPPESAPPVGGDGTRGLSGVAALGDGFIAVGSAYRPGDANPIVVVSEDGRSFEGEDPVHKGAGVQEYTDVCVAPDQTAVVVGEAGPNGAHDITVAVRSPEGEWTKAENAGFRGDGSQQGYACAASEDGFVVVGSDDRSGTTDARVWVSEDGVEWTEVTSGVLGGAGDQWASAAAAVPDGEGWLVAGGDTVTGDADIALWRVDASGSITRRDEGEPALGGPGDQAVDAIEIDDEGTVTLAGSDYGRAGLWESDVLDR